MDARYPIGKMQMPKEITPDMRRSSIESIARTPKNLREAVSGLSESQLDTPYREGGWTVRQVIHHVADSHLNAYIRLRLALTEERPTIKPYAEAAWAELADAKSGPLKPSEMLLESLHDRWDRLWHSLKPEDFSRQMVHPEHGDRSVDWLLFLYEWHGRHHTAHITELRKQKGWEA
ncbi:MAG TPA: putative metal-dependent hydrolase [Candidatus Acidoferrum sp.]|jgi:uncharacterized damage-inducible protein DinB